MISKTPERAPPVQNNSFDTTLQAIGATVFERGWLSSNNVLLLGDAESALVDSGYCSHSAQTLQLVSQGLPQDRPLDWLLNTHLHSDHCGGNAALQLQYPSLKTLIPPGQADAVARWNTVELSYEPTGQECPAFRFQGVLLPGTRMQLGKKVWEIHGAKGHDPHSIILFEPEHRVLISADALWENGFGVVFPELEGVQAFQEVEDTLDVIEQLNPRLVIPGHGSLFSDVPTAISRARGRLAQFRGAPERHLRHAHKVLIKFRLLAWQRIEHQELFEWCRNTAFLRTAMPREDQVSQHEWLNLILEELARSGAIDQENGWVINK